MNDVDVDHVVRLRVHASDSDLRRLGMFLGSRKPATLHDFRSWCHDAIDATFSDMPSDPVQGTTREQPEHHQS